IGSIEIYGLSRPACRPIYYAQVYRQDRYMLDGVSLDQLRTFIAAADEGSFSAAGRRLRRAQSMVSQVLAELEGQLGVMLFGRSARLQVLTNQSRALLASARAVAGDVDLFKARCAPQLMNRDSRYPRQADVA